MWDFSPSFFSLSEHAGTFEGFSRLHPGQVYGSSHCCRSGRRSSSSRGQRADAPVSAGSALSASLQPARISSSGSLSSWSLCAASLCVHRHCSAVCSSSFCCHSRATSGQAKECCPLFYGSAYESASQAEKLRSHFFVCFFLVLRKSPQLL
jgi:hypothetical protein